MFRVGLVKKPRGRTLAGLLYAIPRECVDMIVAWQNGIVIGDVDGNEDVTPSVSYSLSFVGTDGSEVAGCSFSFANEDVMNFGCVRLEEGGRSRNIGGTRLWLISPLVGGFAQSYVKWISVDIPKDDVAKIASATIKVEE